MTQFWKVSIKWGFPPESQKERKSKEATFLPNPSRSGMFQHNAAACSVRMSTMKPKLFGIQIWWYQTFLSHKNKIGRIEIFLLLPDFANFLPCWLAQFCWDSQQGREVAKSGSNKKKFQFCQSYSYVNRKVWYHQIWIPNNLGFIVSDLT